MMGSGCGGGNPRVAAPGGARTAVTAQRVTAVPADRPEPSVRRVMGFPNSKQRGDADEILDLRSFPRRWPGLPLTAACGEVRAFEAAFRGSYVCERMASTRDILRIPARTHGPRRPGRVQASAPRSARRSPRSRGTGPGGRRPERGNASAIAMEPPRQHRAWPISWHDHAIGRHPSGTQTWTGPRGAEPVVRRCTIALVRDEAAQQR